MNHYASDRIFEDDVRRVADALFNIPAGTCKPEIFTKAKKTIEIDGVARTRDIVHLIMATTSTKYEKVKEDVEKLLVVGETETQKQSLVKKWMIVEKNPEAPHTTYAKRSGVELLSFQQFRERFFDGNQYLALREKVAFGSARDPETGSHSIATDEYIEPPITILQSGADTSISKLIENLKQGLQVILVGQFGSGKSLSLREIWLHLRNLYRLKEIEKVPIAINLREHWGAEYADEILRRHARSIGFERESDLIAAWRAGMLILLVDGFDEMASQGVSNLEDLKILKKLRFNALNGVRDLILKTPTNCGVFISGRDHYFDDYLELEHNLGLSNQISSCFHVDEFDEKRAEKYLQRKGITVTLPDWLPKKALLLGYLVRIKLLEQVLSIDSTSGQAKAWHSFLELICRREAEHERAAMDFNTIQQVLEHLAILVRSTPSGIGPISGSMLAQAYRNVTDQIPGDAVLMQLQRLPGLTERDADPGLRSFVDQDFLEALQGFAIARQLIEGLSKKSKKQELPLFEDQNWFEPLGSLASGVAVVQLRNTNWTMSALVDFIRQFSRSQLGADLLKIATTWSAEINAPLDLHGIELEGIQLSSIDLDEYSIRGISIKDSLIETLNIGSFANESEITINNCNIKAINGAGSLEHLPKAICMVGTNTIAKFESLQTTDAIVRLDTDDRIKALLSALKKLFRQRGAGRVEGAFRRGLPSSVEKHMSNVLQLLVREEFAWQLKDVFHPIRNKTRRANQILDNPHASNDPLLTLAKQ